jgi:hypothetical protein
VSDLKRAYFAGDTPGVIAKVASAGGVESNVAVVPAATVSPMP